jgi:hypothetical protein
VRLFLFDFVQPLFDRIAFVALRFTAFVTGPDKHLDGECVPFEFDGRAESYSNLPGSVNILQKLTC